MNKVSRLKIIAVANDLKKGKPYKQALLDNGYSKNTSNMGADNKVIQEALAKISKEMEKEDVTIESVLGELEITRQLAILKEDYATAGRMSELKGRYRAMFTDKREIKQEVITKQDAEILNRYIPRFVDNQP
jgi:hypothetical protein